MLGAAIVRGAACTVNDIMDRGFDAQVGKYSQSRDVSLDSHLIIERTKGRPLPSGRVTVVGASVFLAIQYVLAAAYFAGLKNAALVTSETSH